MRDIGNKKIVFFRNSLIFSDLNKNALEYFSIVSEKLIKNVNLFFYYYFFRCLFPCR